MVYNAYVNQFKYCNGKVNPLLKEKYEKLKFRTKKVNTIKNISVIKNAILSRRLNFKQYNDFILVEDINGLCLLYNISTGEDLSFDSNKDLAFFKGKTNVKILYDYNVDDYQDTLNFGYVDKITLYKNSDIVNLHSESFVKNSDFLEFKDNLGNAFYLDVLFNNIYARKDSFKIVESKMSRKIIIFKKDKGRKININVFNNKLLSFLRLFYDYE